MQGFKPKCRFCLKALRVYKTRITLTHTEQRTTRLRRSMEPESQETHEAGDEPRTYTVAVKDVSTTATEHFGYRGCDYFCSKKCILNFGMLAAEAGANRAELYYRKNPNG